MAWIISGVVRHGELLAEFDEGLTATVKSVTVYSEKDVAVTFKDGSEVHVDTKGKK